MSAILSGIRTGIRSGFRQGISPLARDTVTPTSLTSGSSTTDGTSVATAAGGGGITPVANRVVYAFVNNVRAGGSIATPTCTGCDLTWVEVKTVASAAGTRRLTCFRALGAAPVQGQLTFDFGAQTQDSFAWSVVQFAGADTTGTDGSGATVQSVSQAVASNVTTVTNTLALLENVANVHLAAFAISNNSTVTPDGDFVELSDNGVATTASTLEVEWARLERNCTPTFVSSQVLCISVEVKAKAS